MKKEATRLGARAVEAIAGGLAGAGLGAAGQSLMYEPRKPRRVLDRHGYIRERPLSAAEKKQKRDLVLSAAAMAALGGGAISMGGGVAARRTMSRLERDLAPRLVDSHLDGLRKVVDKRYDVLRRRQESRLVPRASRKAAELDYLNARDLLNTEEDKLYGLLEKARREREKLPWGGSGKRKGGTTPGATVAPDPRSTHAGQIAEHYKKLRREYHLPRFHGPDDRNAGENFYETLLERLSGRDKVAFSFREEALAIQRTLEG